MLLSTFGAVIYGRGYLPADRSILSTLLLGRALTLPLFVATLVATWYGGILGVTEIAFQYGIYNFITQGVFWYLSYLVFAFVIVPRLRQHNAFTLPHLVRMRFGPHAEKITTFFNITNVLPTAYILSAGLLIDTLLGTGVIYGSLIGIAVVLSYSLLGGVRSIIFSDLIQCLVMIVAVYAVFIASWHTYGGWSFLKANLPASHFEIRGGQPTGVLLVWGFIALSTLVDPNFYHRIFSAASDKVAKRGILMATIIWMLFDLATTAGGMYAAAVMGADADSAVAYLEYAMDLLPPGLKGLFIAGILATIFSTMDSYLFIASTTISYDIQKKTSNFLSSYWKNLILSATVAFLLSILFSSNLPGAHGIKDIWKTFGSYSAGCLLVPVMLAIFSWKRYHSSHFLISTFSSATLMTVWRFICRPHFEKAAESAPNLLWLSQTHELYIGLGTSAVVFGLAALYQSKTSLTG